MQILNKILRQTLTSGRQYKQAEVAKSMLPKWPVLDSESKVDQFG